MQATRSKAIADTRSGERLIKRHFSNENISPFDEIGWRKVKVNVPQRDGSIIERELEFPEFWSDQAARIAGAKYFRGRVGSEEWESSAKQMIGRVVKTIRGWGLKSGYFPKNEADIFEAELASILLHQRAAFNSPVWFNVGLDAKPQCSACFILSVEDSMESILEWVKTEGLIFKRGSGAGINLSPLRSTKESLSRGGHSSGPVSFMRGADSVAGMIASGGSTRRAAKMVVMNIEHPDIMKFIRSKAEEEKKVRALIEAGYNMYDLNDDAWNSIQYQNANNSVRVTDDFMRAIERDELFPTRFVTTGQIAGEYRARDLAKDIALAAWECGDPGLQFDTTINDWHTCPNSGRINASNPCSEYMHVDNSACNLASINLLRYLNDDGTFDTKGFIHTVRVMILAQEIIVGHSSYPTSKIEKNTHEFRQLGLGYANLGALLMTLGIAYDSEKARHSAAAITAIMSGEAYKFSAEIAKEKGPFQRYEENREPMMRVMKKHEDSLAGIRRDRVFDESMVDAAKHSWASALSLGEKHGFRNSQVSVLAPTGTIAFMMDCATTGIEPEFALVKMKNLVGGGLMRIVNTTVPDALHRLGYDQNQVESIIKHIEEVGTIEGASELKNEHLEVFDCAVAPKGGSRVISWQGHVKMVASVQPFLSGAVSKTFNMPANTSVDEILESYIMAWKMGLKAFAVYRDGSKAAQPLTTSGSTRGPKTKVTRIKLPPTRQSETHKFSIAGHEGYLTYSMFEGNGCAEIFVRMHKQGSTLAGLIDAFAITVSTALQYGVPLKTLVRKFSYTRFEPAGYTENPEIRIATSITDYIFRYLALRFLSAEDLAELGIKDRDNPEENSVENKAELSKPKLSSPEAKQKIVYAETMCRSCGGMLVQTGSCKTCIQCGTSNGGC